MYSDKCLYTKDHEWVEKGEGSVKIGVTDYAQKELGDIVFVEMPDVGDEFAKGDSFGTVESVKAVSDLYMPVSGKVTAVNEQLEDAPDLVNTSAHEEGWIISIEVQEAGELEGLMDKDAYEKYLETLD